MKIAIKNNDRKNVVIDLSVLFIIMIVSTILLINIDTVFTRIPILLIAFFCLPPTLYLSLRKKKDWKKILATVFLVGLLVGFLFTFIAELTDAWYVPITLIPFRIFEIYTFDDTVCMILFVLLTTVFYQHFFMLKEQNKGINKRFKSVTSFLIVLIPITVLIFKYNPSFFGKEYSYAIWVGIINVIMPVVFLIKKPSFLPNLLLPLIYFFILYFVIEIFGVVFDLWLYHGSYISLISFFGVVYPIDELIFWMLLYTPAIIASYEVFVNNNIKSR